jgi:hypothetical protein
VSTLQPYGYFGPRFGNFLRIVERKLLFLYVITFNNPKICNLPDFYT